MKRFSCGVAAILVMVAGLAQAGNIPASQMTPRASDGVLLEIDACYAPDNINNVTVTYVATGTSNDGGDMDLVCLEIWDDGNLVAGATSSVSYLATQTNVMVASWQGPVGQVAQGIGVQLMDCPSGDLLDYEDPVDLVPCGTIPTLTEWGFIVTALLLGLGAWRRLSARAV